MNFFIVIYRLATRPPSWEKGTTNTKWHKATTLASTQPLTMNQKIIVEQPIPPPRKKKLDRAHSVDALVENNNKANKVRNGFRDVFGTGQNNLSLQRDNHGSYDTIDHQESSSIASGDEDVHYAKLVKNGNLKIGNKKSDKFFGESLSDSLSDEPFDPTSEKLVMQKRRLERDELDAFVEANVPKLALKPQLSDDSQSSVGKKAAFLMTMLDNDEARYHGRVPVEEPIIVPVRKRSKHICDETENLIKHLKHDESEHIYDEVKKSKKDGSTQTPGPKKPQRDLELYRKSLQAKTDQDVTDEKQNPSPPIRRKKSLKAETNAFAESASTPPPANPPKLSAEINALPPELPPKTTDHSIISDERPTIRHKRLNSSSHELSSTSSSSRIKRGGSTKILQKSASSHSFLTHDLMRSLVNRVYGIEDYSIEDICQDSHQVDGSMAVSQNIQKLKNRKISSQRKISTGSEQSIPEMPEQTTDGSSARLVQSQSCNDESLSVKKQNLESHTNQFIPKPVYAKSAFVIGVVEAPKPQISSNDLNKIVKTIDQTNTDGLASANIENESNTETSKKNTEKLLNEEASHAEKKVILAVDAPKLEDDTINLAEVVKSHKKTHPNARSTDVMQELCKQQDIVFAFEKFIEYELNSHEAPPPPKYLSDVALEEGVRQAIQLTDAQLAEEKKAIDLSLHQTSTPPKPLIQLDALEESIENQKLDLVSVTSSESDASTLRYKSDSESDTEESNGVANKNLLQVQRLNLRRESIEDVDNWFTKHADIPYMDPTQTSMSEETKRAVAQMTAYNHNKLFPFGDIRSRHDSMNDEFFDAKPNSPKISKNNSISEE